MKKLLLMILSDLLSAAVWGQNTTSASGNQVLANKLANPVASLISVPLQNNADWGIGHSNGSKNLTNIQPVIPIMLTANWNLITRYILPVVDQYDVSGDGSHQWGLSDMTVSAFFSPVPKGSFIWAIGPAFLIPTSTNNLLGTGRWGVGPTGLILYQKKQWTAGFLVNQIWSFAGPEDRSKVNQLYFQPFVAYSWPSGASLGANSEITFNWESKTTTIYVNTTLSGITKVGKQTMQLTIGPRIPVDGPFDIRPSIGVRSVVTFIFPQ